MQGLQTTRPKLYGRIRIAAKPKGGDVGQEPRRCCRFRAVFDAKKVFEHAVFIPLLAMFMEEEIGWEMIRVERGEEIRREIRDLDDRQGVPNELRVIEDVVSGG